MVTALLVSSATSTTELWASNKFCTAPKTRVRQLQTWCLSLSSCMAPAGDSHGLLLPGLSPAATDATGTWHTPHSLCPQVTQYEPTALTFSRSES